MSEKLSITLPSEMLKTIKSRVEIGDYASTSEVLREAMRLWLQREADRQEALQAIRARVKASIEDPRLSLSIDEVSERLERLYSKYRPAGE